MKYYLDTEFHEYHKKQVFGKSIPTIDLISIGIVANDGREYCAISKDFDLKAAWNSWQPKTEKIDTGMAKVEVKEYWLRENVLYPIWKELYLKKEEEFFGSYTDPVELKLSDMTYYELKSLIKADGKSNSQIVKEIEKFCSPEIERYNQFGAFKYSDPEFYGYYADYDWVVFSQLYGRMMNLPKGFPMYCKDLKQMLDEKCPNGEYVLKEMDNKKIKIKNHFRYPIQDNEHNALEDAKWNQELHKFIQNI